MQASNRLDYPSRNQSLENEIDHLLAIELLSVQSIRVYLDVVVTLLDRYHEKPAAHTARNLADFIRRQNITLTFNRPPYYLESKHLNYLSDTYNYIQTLKDAFNTGSRNPWDIVDRITDNIQFQISNHNASNTDLIKFVRDRFAMHPDQQCVESGHNLEIRLSYPEIIIYVVRTWDDFSLPISRHAVSLIVCTSDLSSVPDEVFSRGKLRSLSSLNHSNRFESIYLRNPLYQCIEMVDGAVARLKSKHPDLEQAVESLALLLTELKKVNIQTHRAIEPQGHLILKGVKNCLNRVQPLQDMMAGLPDTDTIRFTENRLEQTAFALSAFSTNLSSRLNTKKYIIASLSQTLRNDGLYKHKQRPRTLGNAFSEPNLTTILAGNLACFYHDQKTITVQTEVQMGGGIADIVVTYEGNISAIIEGKLIQKPNQTHSKVLDGLNQLYNRYGDHNSILDTFGVELYLVLFAYDQKSKNLTKETFDAVAEFSKRHSIELQTHSEGQGYLHFSFIDNCEGTGLSEKKRSILILYCNMEVEKKDEPSYRVTKTPK